jgi:YVTN family beta-propeller protein
MVMMAHKTKTAELFIGVIIIFFILAWNYIKLQAIESISGDILYVANQGSNTISVINETTNKVVTTIPVGIHPVRIIAHSANPQHGGHVAAIPSPILPSS